MENTDFFTVQEYMQLKMRIAELELKVAHLELKLRSLRKKPKLSLPEQAAIQEKYANGISMRNLSQEYNCSVGLIHKIIHQDTTGGSGEHER